MWLNESQERTIGFDSSQTVPCVNSSGMEIPAFSVVRTAGIVTDRTNANYQLHQCYRPNAASMSNGLIIFSGPAAIASGDRFQGHIIEMGRHAALIAKYAGTAPAVGDNVGTDTDTFTLKKNNAGFVVTGVNTSEGLCYVRPFSAGWGVFPKASAQMYETFTSPATGTHYTAAVDLAIAHAIAAPFVVFVNGTGNPLWSIGLTISSAGSSSYFDAIGVIELLDESNTVLAKANGPAVGAAAGESKDIRGATSIFGTYFNTSGEAAVFFSLVSAGTAVKARGSLILDYGSGAVVDSAYLQITTLNDIAASQSSVVKY